MMDKALNLNNSMFNLNQLIENMDFNDDYDTQLNNDPNIDNPPYITLEYLDAYNWEKITLEPIIINEYGLTKYTISVESYNMDNELELNDMFYCREIGVSESKLKQIENKTLKTKTKYLETKPLILTAFGSKMITIENSIFNRECFLNITHTHFYYGQTITLETGEFSDIEPFLILRDFFKSVELKGD